MDRLYDKNWLEIDFDFGGIQMSTSVFDTVCKRRSVKKFKSEMPSRTYIEKILEAATWAPNHRKTYPWRFSVLTGTSREQFGNALKQSIQEDVEINLLHKTAKSFSESKKPLTAPVIIVVWISSSMNDRILYEEDLLSGAAAIQNLMLAAHELQLGTIWRTGKWLNSNPVRDFFSLSSSDHILGFIYLGYPEEVPVRQKSISWEEITTWLE